MRYAVSIMFEWLALLNRRAAGSMYPSDHPLNIFHHEIVDTLAGATRRYHRGV